MGLWVLLGVILATPGQPTIIHGFEPAPRFQTEALCKAGALEFIETGTQWEYEDTSVVVPMCEIVEEAHRA